MAATVGVLGAVSTAAIAADPNYLSKFAIIRLSLRLIIDDSVTFGHIRGKMN